MTGVGTKGVARTKSPGGRLTGKQDAFARHMPRVQGNQTKAAIAAGYAERSARQIGSENMTKPDVIAAVERYSARAAARVELSTDQVLMDIQEIGACATDAGKYGPALRAQELLGKSLGMWTERSANLSVKVDTSQAHLQALLKMAKRRAAEPLDINLVNARS